MTQIGYFENLWNHVLKLDPTEHEGIIYSVSFNLFRALDDPGLTT